MHVRVITGPRPDKSDIDGYEAAWHTKSPCQQDHKETLNMNSNNIIQENNQASCKYMIRSSCHNPIIKYIFSAYKLTLDSESSRG